MRENEECGLFSERLGVAKSWINGRRNGVSFSEFLKHELKIPAIISAERNIEKIEVNEGYILLKLRCVQIPIYIPSSVAMSKILPIIAELTEKSNWHYYEVPETMVQEDDYVADIGAAEGLFTLLVYQRARHVFTIEPLPLWVDSLRRTFASIPNVTILPFGAACKRGNGTICESNFSSRIEAGTSKQQGENVELVAIDDIFYEKGIPLTYIKADIEGYEEEMLEGARRTISINKPRIAITTYHHNNNADLMMRIIRDSCQEYHFRLKGIRHYDGKPMMLHAWVPSHLK